MSRLILFIIFLLLFYTLLYYLIKDRRERRKKLNREADPEELVQDPYCQTYIPKRSAFKKKIGGRWLCFCSQECLRKFLQTKS